MKAGALASRLAPHLPALAAASVGVLWFLGHVGALVVDPTNVAWLMRADWSANYLGWAFFRHAPFGWPLGANPDYPVPAGSTLGFTDSTPIVGVLLRPLSALLPEPFQYVGLWLVLCFALQGFVGAKLVRIAAPGALAQFFGGSLFALAPPLLHRVVGPHTGHASLSAHWLVLGFLWLALARADRGPGRRLAAVLGLLLVASGVHPYHVAMGAAFAEALVLRLWLERSLDPRRAVAAALAVPLAAAAGLFAFGYLGSDAGSSAGGFGFFSADTLSLVSPMGWSRAWTGPKVGHVQYEGFGYLGAGGLLAAAGAIGSVVVRRRAISGSRWRAALPALGVALILAAVAFSNRITLAGDLIASFELGSTLEPIAAAFRSSGRFIWALGYLTTFAALAAIAVAWRDRPRAVAGAFAAALLVQVADVRPPTPMDAAATAASWTPPRDDAWMFARGVYRHVALFPPYLIAKGAPVAPDPKACGGLVYPWDANLVPSEVALRLGATINSAYAALLDSTVSAQGCVALLRSVLANRLDPQTIYVVHPNYLKLFAPTGAPCARVDGLPVCVSAANRDAFSEVLRRRAGR